MATFVVCRDCLKPADVNGDGLCADCEAQVQYAAATADPIRDRGSRTFEVLRWRRDRAPDAEGYWLRFNAGHRVSLHRVIRLDLGAGERLFIDWGRAEGARLVDLDNPKLRGWLWYGPIESPLRFTADPRRLVGGRGVQFDGLDR